MLCSLCYTFSQQRTKAIPVDDDADVDNGKDEKLLQRAQNIVYANC